MPKRHPRWGDDAIQAGDETPGLRETWDGPINALDVYEPDGDGLIGAFWAAEFQDDVGGFESSKQAIRNRNQIKWRTLIRSAYLQGGVRPQEYIDAWRSRGGNGRTLEFGEYQEGTTLEELRRHLGF